MPRVHTCFGYCTRGHTSYLARGETGIETGTAWDRLALGVDDVDATAEPVDHYGVAQASGPQPEAGAYTALLEEPEGIWSDMSDERIDAIVDEHGLPAETDNTITDRESLFDDLETIRDRRVAPDEEERVDGTGCIGVPVDTGDRREAAISITAPLHRLTAGDTQQRIIEMVKQTANAIEVNPAHESRPLEFTPYQSSGRTFETAPLDSRYDDWDGTCPVPGRGGPFRVARTESTRVADTRSEVGDSCLSYLMYNCYSVGRERRMPDRSARGYPTTRSRIPYPVQGSVSAPGEAVGYPVLPGIRVSALDGLDTRYWRPTDEVPVAGNGQQPSAPSRTSNGPCTGRPLVECPVVLQTDRPSVADVHGRRTLNRIRHINCKAFMMVNNETTT
ncbi:MULTISPECIES: IclR family transcriptional regulator domain-containing protein [Haloarcula]|uniref:IclR family transcriptional regulator domain-containing protein n=1 Tax=Haloarcula TaxID=2237 RepID=UPI0023EE0357|nr:IclR family transcriptional regulator C-terminal domain-containing protein [Halomicroarcula sp. XH51]